MLLLCHVIGCVYAVAAFKVGPGLLWFLPIRCDWMLGFNPNPSKTPKMIGAVFPDTVRLCCSFHYYRHAQKNIVHRRTCGDRSFLSLI